MHAPFATWPRTILDLIFQGTTNRAFRLCGAEFSDCRITAPEFGASRLRRRNVL